MVESVGTTNQSTPLDRMRATLTGSAAAGYRGASEAEFARRESEDFLGVTLAIVMLDDIVLSKAARP